MAVNAVDIRARFTQEPKIAQVSRNSPTVFVLDEDWTVVAALSGILRPKGFSVRAWMSGAAFLRAHNAQVPGCLVTDPCMPRMSGLDVQRELLARGIDRPIVFVTGQGDMRTTVLGMKAGAVTFLAKPVQPAELIEAVREAIARDATNRAQRCEHLAISAGLAQLTPREREVLRLLRTGMLNKQIAAELGVGEQTIKVHRGQILQKMGVRSGMALMALLHRANLPANFGSSEGIKRRRLPSVIANGGQPGMAGFSRISRAARQPPACCT